MIKAALFFSTLIFALSFPLQLFAQAAPPAGFDLSNYGVKIEPDKRLMTVLATLEAARTKNAAGEETPLVKTALSAQGESFRAQMRADLAAMPEDLRGKISLFVEQYKRRHP